jgi:peptidoglycan/xylan/chitin deacetylase (PgdA/CDA1 family)
MTDSLWASNHPRDFWLCQPEPLEEVWQSTIAASLPALGLPLAQANVQEILAQTLGEGRFGPAHWSLSFPKRIYYRLKPLLPRIVTRFMRQLYRPSSQTVTEIQWPIEPRYVDFLWSILAQLVRQSREQSLLITALWPEGRRFALVLTHDVESKVGVAYVRQLADLEESLGFRSSFNFVPEGYPLDTGLIDELRRRGFEVGIHGLQHDGRLFESRPAFEKKAAKINTYLKKTGATGFRAPLTIRHPEWMQSLDLEYDLSFFDTDPFEPIPGGTMSIWPFFLGRFIELPYTLVQDYTLTDVLKQDSPRTWLEKVGYIREHCGMALLNSHPDYLRNPARLDVYERFLRAMREEQECWKALPCEAAAWWKERRTSDQLSAVSLDADALCISPQPNSGRGQPHRVRLPALPA